MKAKPFQEKFPYMFKFRAEKRAFTIIVSKEKGATVGFLLNIQILIYNYM